MGSLWVSEIGKVVCAASYCEYSQSDMDVRAVGVVHIMILRMKAPNFNRGTESENQLRVLKLFSPYEWAASVQFVGVVRNKHNELCPYNPD